MAVEFDAGPVPVGGGSTRSGVTLLPMNPRRFGPVTRRLLSRTALGLVALFCVGAVLAIVPEGPVLPAVGLSLIVPGGGFLYLGAPLLFVLTLLLFGLGLVLWWGVSAVLAPWVVLALAAAGAGLLARGADETWNWAAPVVFAIALLVVGIAVVRFERAYRRKVRSIPELNRYLATAPTPCRPTGRLEPDEIDSSVLGWLLDTATQPIDEFNSFDHGEQYHGRTCLRYQLNFLGSALAMANVNLLPNYPQVVVSAQEKLVEKNTDIRVWRYWLLENLLGNLDRNPDPIVRDNIMFSGFLVNQICEFEAASGSTRFGQPGSLEFVWRDGRRFVYDLHSISEVVASNFERADLGIFPCEPGWVFSTCNVIAAQGLLGYDTIHGAGLFARVERGWREGLFSEMITPDGAMRHIRSSLFGFSFVDGDNSGEYFIAGTHQLVDVAPDMALRGSLLQLRGVPQKMAALRKLLRNGELDLHLEPKSEKGTRYLTSLPEWIGVIAGAQAVGDEELERAARRAMMRDCGSGVRFPQRPIAGSAMTIALLAATMWSRPVSLADLARRGYVQPTGPVLENAPWPDVLVSKARCDDGISLDLVIEPHVAASGGTHELTFRTVTPGEHRLVGDGVDLVLTPDDDGLATVPLTLNGRMTVTLTPVRAAL